MGKTLVILNPASGRGRAAQRWGEVEAALHEAGVEFDLARTHQSLHAVQLAWDAAQQGYERVVSVGGDGLAHEIANGLLRASNEGETLSLGLIPLGNGNDFIKMLPPECRIGENHDDWRPAVRRLVAGQTALFDVGRIEGDRPAPGRTHPDYFINAMDVGFGAQVARNVRDTPRFFRGTSMYIAGVLKTLASYNIPHLHLQLDDGRVLDQSTTITAVTNGRCFAGSFWIAPEASASDGTFEVVVAQGLGPFRILSLLPRVMKGTHVNLPIVKMLKSSHVVVDSQAPLIVEADGEIPFLDARHLEIQMLPKRLRVVV